MKNDTSNQGVLLWTERIRSYSVRINDDYKTIDAEEHTKELWNMNKLIKREEALSQEYMFETIDHNGMKIVKLSQDNVARALAMIANDSTYYKAMDVDAKPSPDGKNRPHK